MKSTLKIDYASQGNLGKPVIKIVQPVSVIDQSDFDAHVEGLDVKDVLINNLLQCPMNPWLNDWFEVSTRFPVRVNPETPDSVLTHYITTIAAVQEDKLFFRFKKSILNRMIPYEDHVRINRDDVPFMNNNIQGTRKTERIDHSVEKHAKIIEFFKWLEETEPATWEEQQPVNEDGSRRNA